MTELGMVLGWSVVSVAVVCVLGYVLTRYRFIPHAPKQKLPEMVCTCGDCWELTGDRWQLIECGCDTCYTVLAERKSEP